MLVAMEMDTCAGGDPCEKVRRKKLGGGNRKLMRAGGRVGRMSGAGAAFGKRSDAA